MKQESVLTVLMYLLKYRAQENVQTNVDLEALEANLVQSLEKQGFDRLAISKAFEWLSNFTNEQLSHIRNPENHSIRVFSHNEKTFLNQECQNFILSLERKGILTPLARELVIHQSIALHAEGIDLGLIKWVTLLVLFHQSEGKALAYMEYLVLSDNIFDVAH